MRRIPRFIKWVATTYGRRLLRGHGAVQARRMVDSALTEVTLHAKLLTHEGDQRSAHLNRQLAWAMAFVAGAVNAGGFIAVGRYTSHMTGVTSTMADNLALGDLQLALAAFAMMACFMAGAFVCTTLISWGKRRHMVSRYAVSLTVEAALLLAFGIMGARLEHKIRFDLPATVSLLCFIMGMHNAVTTNISGAAVRTTHVTGTVTDIGIELSKLLYVNVHDHPGRERIVANREKLVLLSVLLLSFFAGGVTGALGFKHVGFKVTIPLAGFLLLLAARPILHEFRVLMRELRRYLKASA